MQMLQLPVKAGPRVEQGQLRVRLRQARRKQAAHDEKRGSKHRQNGASSGIKQQSGSFLPTVVRLLAPGRLVIHGLPVLMLVNSTTKNNNSNSNIETCEVLYMLPERYVNVVCCSSLALDSHVVVLIQSMPAALYSKSSLLDFYDNDVQDHPCKFSNT